MNLIFENIIFLSSEIILVLTAVVLLMVGAFKKKNNAKIVVYLSFIVLILLSIIEMLVPWSSVTIFNNSIIQNGYTRFVKIMIYFSSSFTIILSSRWLMKYDDKAFEYPILILFSVLGMSLMVSANDLITLYLAIELQSLPLYVLASFKRNNTESSEAGVKYFVLGALSSSLFLFGASIVYGFSSSVEFGEIYQSLQASEINTALIIGLVFVLSGLIFKISAVPFHMWTPDVYQGSATPVTAFFATAPKLAALCMLINILFGPLSGMNDSWYQIIFFVSMASIALGTFSAIRQTNIKRLLAYSSIAHMGFALIGLLSFPNLDGIQSLLLYMLIYLVTTLGVFSCIISLEITEGESITKIDDFSGISKNYPFTAFTIAMFMFSYAGIPPLGGFFAKYLIFRSAIDNGLIFLSVFGLLLSVVGAFYYIRIVKLMYFDEPKTIVKKSFSKSLSFTNTICLIFIISFIFIITIAPITELTETAAIALAN